MEDATEIETEKAELTSAQAHTLRLAARILTNRSEAALAHSLTFLADEVDAPQLCEACDAPATESDSEGTQLCREHYEGLLREQRPEPEQPKADPLPRTVEQIAARVEEVQGEDFFGAEASDLLTFLPFETCRRFLKDGVTQEEWSKAMKPLTRDAVIAEMREYMGFAIGKAEDEKGPSASRSISHYRAWLWLLGDDELLAFARENYEPYGIPILKRICEKYGFAWSAS